jgi:hypothetical protein
MRMDPYLHHVIRLRDQRYPHLPRGAIRFYIDVLSAHTRGDLFDWTLTSEDEYLRACIPRFSHDYGPCALCLRGAQPKLYHSEFSYVGNYPQPSFALQSYITVNA